MENIRLKDRDRYPEGFGITLNQRPVLLIIARIHDQKRQVERAVAVPIELLHQFRQQDGIFPAGDAHGDPVPGPDQLIALDRVDERLPEPFPVLLQDAPFHRLTSIQIPAHDLSPFRTLRPDAPSICLSVCLSIFGHREGTGPLREADPRLSVRHLYQPVR